MIDIDFGKLLLVAIIALIILGPEKLPKAARMAGKMLRRARLSWDSVRAEVEHELELEEIRRTVRESAQQADAARRAAEAEVKSAGAAVHSTVDDLAKAAEAAKADVSKAPPEVHDGDV